MQRGDNGDRAQGVTEEVLLKNKTGGILLYELFIIPGGKEYGKNSQINDKSSGRNDSIYGWGS